MPLNDVITSQLSSNGENEDDDETVDNVALDDEVDNGDDDASSEEVVMYCQYFSIKGAAWEERYQHALQICSRKLLLKEEVQIKVTSQPKNIRDKNALKFETLQRCKTSGLFWGIVAFPKSQRGGSQ